MSESWASAWRGSAARRDVRRKAQPSADAYPSQTVRIVVPFSAGSNTDGQARILADKLADVEATGDRREPARHCRNRERGQGARPMATR